VADVDLAQCKIRVNQGKGAKDRYVLFGKGFATALRTHVAAHPHNRWLFQTRRHDRFTTRRVQQVVKLDAGRAGVNSTPHTFRHQAITWLTRHSGLADAELQLITDHAPPGDTGRLPARRPRRRPGGEVPGDHEGCGPVTATSPRSTAGSSVTFRSTRRMRRERRGSSNEGQLSRLRAS
jgi:integrase